MLLGLVGMPGGGKSTVGRQLARRLRADFVDTDTVLEQRIGMPIRSFFEAYGEARFRDLETETLSGVLQMAAGSTTVFATGGGIVLREANRKLLRERATVVYLRSTPEDLYRRLRHDTQRPLLQVSNPLAKLRELYKERDPLYNEVAHFVIDTGRPSVAMLANMILMQLEVAGVIDPMIARSPVDEATRPLPRGS